MLIILYESEKNQVSCIICLWEKIKMEGILSIPTDIHATLEWTDERIEHTYANAISEMPDISDQNTIGIRGKRIEALGLAWNKSPV